MLVRTTCAVVLASALAGIASADPIRVVSERRSDGTVSFIDRDAQTNKQYRAEMFKYSGGDPTVPCIVEDGEYRQSGWGNPLRG